MAKLWSMALALFIGAGLWAVPAMAQSSDADDVAKVTRGGGEGVDTSLGKKGLGVETDGFALWMSTRVQFRLTYQTEVGNGPDGTNGRTFINFRVRRAKTNFKGFIFDKDFQYNLLLNWTSGGNNIIEEAWFRWAIMQYINVTAGQTKLQYNWEEAVSSGAQQFVERGYVNEKFNQDYAKGITLDGKIGEDVSWLKYWIGIYNGVLKGNTDFRNADWALRADTFDNLTDGEMMINLRLETHPMGDVARSMNDMRSKEEMDKILFAIGLGFNWFMSGFDAPDLRGDTATGSPASGRFRTSQDTMSVVLDGHFRFYGLSVDIEFHMRHTEFHNRGRNRFNPQRDEPLNTALAATGNLTDYGISFLIAYFILPEQLNVGIRWDHFDADEVWANAGNQSRTRFMAVHPDANEIGLSVNYYIHGNNLKLTFDLLMVSQTLAFSANTADSSGNRTLNGVYNSVPERHAFTTQGFHLNRGSDHNDLWIIRLQLQWIF
ncbi:MAG: hypothetical protein KF696_06805 [Planctomycetes bacterium]|nr:hypothetical protein [Planctomycetota bacterium]MCW8135265.1 hypothetical protein [Planctomycetota bacterium]